MLGWNWLASKVLKFVILISFLAFSCLSSSQPKTPSNVNSLSPCSEFLPTEFDDVAMEWLARMGRRTGDAFTILAKPFQFKANLSSQELKAEILKSLEEEAKIIDASFDAEIAGNFDQTNALQANADKIADQRFTLLRIFLKKNNVNHLVLHATKSKRPHIVILPSGDSDWNRMAGKFFTDHGTMLVIRNYSDSVFLVKPNIFYLNPERVVNGINDWVLKNKKNLEKNLLSEMDIEISSKKNVQTLYDFLFNPENAIPRSLRFLNMYSPPNHPLAFNERLSFRTGLVNELADSIKKNIESLSRVPRLETQITAVLALRKADGTWIHTIPEISDAKSADGYFDQSFKEMNKHIGTRKQDREIGLPDLFFIVNGLKDLSMDADKFLKQLATNKEIGLNSVSFVVLRQSKTHGPIYYIHTLENRNAKDTTLLADQLFTHFDRAAAFDKMMEDRIEFDPFVIKGE